MKFLLDTTVVTELAKPRPHPQVVDWVEKQSSMDLAISALTLGELTRSVRSHAIPGRREELTKWIADDLPQQFRGRLYDIDDEVVQEWGKLAADSKLQGRELPVIDGLLLATAKVHGLTFVTRNESDCAARGVDVINPWHG
jgi:predicted nucleic acid-binding protein